MTASKVWIHNNTLIISFQYSPVIVNRVREIDGRIFNKTAKRWEAPMSSILQCVDLLKPLNFSMSADVIDAYRYDILNRMDVAHIKSGASIEIETKLPLYEFQKRGAAFLRFLDNALLADAPGLGKTLQTAAALELERGPILVLVPASLKFNWQEELHKWVPKEKTLVINGNKQQRRELWFHASKKRAKWVIANYELLLHDLEEMKQPWAAIVCDEADRISNPYAKTTQALKKLQAGKRIALTGTPVSNTPEDLWSITDWLQPRMLGTYRQFQERYCKLHPEYRRVIGYQNLDQLRERIDPIMLRRQKEDVLTDFPAKTMEHIVFELTKDERTTYDGVRKLIKEELAKMPDMDRRSLAILPVKMLRLKQLTDDARLLYGAVGGISGATPPTSTKLATLKEMLKPIIASGEKAIIFTQFAEMAKILFGELTTLGYEPLMIHGGVDIIERQQAVNNLRDDPDSKVIIMTEAGAYGLNLQAASYVFHYDAPWSVAKIEQREGRAHRVGQDKPVTVYHLIAKNTIDQYVLKVLSGKRDMSDKILGDGQYQEDEVAPTGAADMEAILDNDELPF